MKPEDYPIEPPKEIFHFPQGIMCLQKIEDTGKESVVVTRLSGDEFEFEITPKELSEEEQMDFPVRVYEHVESEDVEGEVTEVIKSEKRINLIVNNKHKQVLKDGETFRMGNTISYNAGTNLITLDDSVGAGDSWGTAYTMENVLSTCGAVVTKQGVNAYDVSARMLFVSGAYFISESEFVELKPNPTNPSYTFLINSGAHVRFGNWNSSSDYSYNGAFWRFYFNANSGNRSNRNDGEWLIYGSNIWHDSTHFNKSWNFWGKTRMFDTEVEGTAYISGVDTNLQRVNWKGKNKAGSYDMLLASGYNFAWAGVRSVDAQKGIFMSSTVTSDIDLYDVVLADNSPYDYFESGNRLMRFINSVFDRTKVYVPSGRKGLQECYTYNIKVTESNGDAIIGATVTLKDVDGVNAFTPENTVAGGVLASDKIVRVWWKGYDDLGGIKDYNNHTIKVTKDGYVPYETTITVNHQIKNDQVVLLPYVPTLINPDQEVL